VPDAALSGHLGALRLAERLHEAYHVAVCRPLCHTNNNI
jgi:hypothetical protein